MPEFYLLVVIFAIAFLATGPIALILSIIALNKCRSILEQMRTSRPAQPFKPAIEPAQPKSAAPEPSKTAPHPETPPPEKVIPPAAPEPAVKEEQLDKAPSVTTSAPQETISLEQKIGTKWILIAGIIVVIFAVGYFLKYVIDNNLIGPFGRVVVAAFAGFIALAVGELTRKRGYGIVAKGVTALGFAILYIDVYFAYRWYELINSTPAMILAVVVIASAMLYAVALDEIIIAFLSLLGGFLNPIILSTGENLPIPLFSYTLILGAGGMLCAYYRKWRVIDILVFVGTFLLYIGWFEKFFRPQLANIQQAVPEQMSIALGWLGVFFTVYLILPLLHQLVKKLKAREEDILIVFANASINASG